MCGAFLLEPTVARASVIPMVHRLETDPVDVIEKHDSVRVNADVGLIEVKARSKSWGREVSLVLM